MKNFQMLMDKETGAGGGGNAAPVIDTKALAKEMASLLGETFKPMFESLKPAAKTETETNQEPPPQKKEANKDEGEVLTLRRELEKLNKAQQSLIEENKKTKQDAETKELHAQIRTSLSDFPFVSDSARELAFNNLKDRISKKGSALFGPDDVPLKDFLANELEQTYDFLLSKKDVGGAGATGGGRRDAGIDLDDIRPGMSAEQLAAARAQIARLVK